MKIFKIFKSMTKPQRVENTKPDIPPPPIFYDRNNVTAKEFKEYIHYLAKYKINKVVHEPDRFVTEAERQKKKEFQEYVHYLAENKINRFFIG